MNILQKVLGILSVMLSLTAQATLISNGTTEFVTFRDCIAGSSGCDNLSRVLMSSSGGVPGDTSSSANATYTGYGSASGSVALSGSIGAPILKASATSEFGKRVNTNSVALQRYTYDGMVAATRTFGGTLTYSQALTGVYPNGVGTGIFAAIDIFSLPGMTVDVGASPAAYFNDMISENFAGYANIARAEYQDRTSTSSGVGTLSVEVVLNPGDTVWVWTLLQTPAANGSTVDASHTFITQWNNIAGLTPAAAIPEPESLGLLCLALASASVALRRGMN